MLSLAEAAQQREAYDINEARAVYIARMLAEGNKILYPEDNELLIDIDSEDHYNTFLNSFHILARECFEEYGQTLTWSEKESRSGYPRKHIYIRLPFEVDVWQRIAWQAALGSDPVRELLSSIRALRGDEHPTLLVEAQ